MIFVIRGLLLAAGVLLDALFGVVLGALFGVVLGALFGALFFFFVVAEDGSACPRGSTGVAAPAGWLAAGGPV